jgi:hypothetical protein
LFHLVFHIDTSHQITKQCKYLRFGTFTSFTFPSLFVTFTHKTASHNKTIRLLYHFIYSFHQCIIISRRYVPSLFTVVLKPKRRNFTFLLLYFIVFHFVSSSIYLIVNLHLQCYKWPQRSHCSRNTNTLLFHKNLFFHFSFSLFFVHQNYHITTFVFFQCGHFDTIFMSYS